MRETCPWFNYIQIFTTSSINCRIRNHVGIAKLASNLKEMAQTSIINCDSMSGGRKNWMPLTVNGTLYLVVDAYPLTIMQIHPTLLECTVVQEDIDTYPSLQAVRNAGELPIRYVSFGIAQTNTSTNVGTAGSTQKEAFERRKPFHSAR